MDAITLAMAKAYSDSKGGYARKDTKTLTWDGDTTNSENIFDTAVVKISDEIVDLSTASAVTLRMMDGGGETLAKNDFTVFYEEGLQLLTYPLDDKVLLVNVPVESENVFAPGLYATVFEDVYRFESVTLVTETIHPIDPKYLPGVCLPVVEITSAEYPQSGTVALSAEESAALTAAASMNVGAVIRYTLQTIPMTIVAQSLMGTMFVDAINNPAFQFKASDDGWIMGE